MRQQNTGTWRPIAINASCKVSENPLSLSTINVQETQRTGGISVFDAKNQFLGELLVIADLPSEYIELFLPDTIKAFVKLDKNGGNIISDYSYSPEDNTYFNIEKYKINSTPNRILYTDSNCSRPYTGGNLYDDSYSPTYREPLVILGNGSVDGKYFIIRTTFIDPNVDRVAVNIKSIYGNFPKLGGEGCHQTDSTYYKIPKSNYEITEVNLPFSLPVSFPLRFE